MQDQFCAVISHAAAEPLAGSLPITTHYFLLEYNAAWEDKAFEKSQIPDAVKKYLSELVKAYPAAKVLLIKQPRQVSRIGIHFFVASVHENRARLYRFLLADYLDILQLDLLSIGQGDSRYDANLQETPLFLACTNGRRDLCCARFGAPLYHHLHNLAGDAAWESSHVGGHRFAPNVLVLPQGLMYGRLEIEQVGELVGLTRSGQLKLENLRGRSVYPQAAQAAEIYLRQQTGQLAWDALHLLQAGEVEPNRWQVRFVDTQSGREYALQVVIQLTEQVVYESCSLDKPIKVKILHPEMNSI